ncbi:MAG: D-alanyl-D-alanine carboxypeptidase [Paracoccus sp. (in: a-proteobacteria)]
MTIGIFSNRRQILAGLLGSVLAGPVMAQDVLNAGLAVPPPRKPPPRPGRLIAGAGLDAEIDYAVFNPAGDLLEGRGADHPVAPASTLKVLTALYALDRLGPETRFQTQVMRAGSTLVLVGAGDPTLDTDQLAELAGRTVTEWSGGPPERFCVIGEKLPYIAEISPGQDDYLTYNPAVSGIMLNFNRVHLSWKAGGGAMSLQARALRNSPPAYTIRAAAVGQGPLFSWREEGGREFWSVNRAGLRRAGSRWLPVRRPGLYTGDVFQTLCRARGLVLPNPEVIQSELADMQLVASVDSPPLRDILRDMMEYSTNLTAEAVGLHASRQRDLVASARDMQTWVETRGIAGLDLWDHSGLSPDTRVTARAMAQIIATMGQDAGLPNLMKHVSLQDARGRALNGDLRLDAKTGTLNFVSNLAGYGRIPARGQVVFAIFINDMARRAATEGQELPAGVISWTHRAKFLQQQLVDSWVRDYG